MLTFAEPALTTDGEKQKEAYISLSFGDTYWFPVRVMVQFILVNRPDVYHILNEFFSQWYVICCSPVTEDEAAFSSFAPLHFIKQVVVVLCELGNVLLLS